MGGSWTGDQLQEESGDYTVQASFLFAHERLEADQSSLLVMEWFYALPGGAELSTESQFALFTVEHFEDSIGPQGLVPVNVPR